MFDRGTEEKFRVEEQEESVEETEQKEIIRQFKKEDSKKKECRDTVYKYHIEDKRIV